jgi:hypothetical protein
VSKADLGTRAIDSASPKENAETFCNIIKKSVNQAQVKVNFCKRRANYIPLFQGYFAA